MYSMHLLQLGIVLLGVAEVLGNQNIGVRKEPDPTYDHQTVPYTPTASVMNWTGADLTATLFWSPFSSIEALTELVTGAAKGSRIYFGTPGWSSWNSCSFPPNYDDDACDGCSVREMQNDSFPMFPAVLNALHEQKAEVTILTNDFGVGTCPGLITPLDFMALNGAKIATYTSTTFWHSKFLRVECSPPQCSGGENKTAVSSVNFSKTSFLRNREAGVIFTDAGAGADMAAYFMKTYMRDFAQATPFVPPSDYSPSEMEEITSSAHYPVTFPPPPTIPHAYQPPRPYLDAKKDVQVSVAAAPDATRDWFLGALNSSTSSFVLFVYQVTDQGFADALVATANRGVNVSLLVSSRIFDASDNETAFGQIYPYLASHAPSISITLTPDFFEFSHQKVWVVDEATAYIFTGNWSPSDAPWPPSQSNSYPPYSSPLWQNVNRDFGVAVGGAGGQHWVQQVLETFQQDAAQGTRYHP